MFPTGSEDIQFSEGIRPMEGDNADGGLLQLKGQKAKRATPPTPIPSPFESGMQGDAKETLSFG